MSGYGEMTSKDGYSFKGYYYNDMKHGNGIETLTSGEIYKGYWKDDNKEGKMNYTFIGGAECV